MGGKVDYNYEEFAPGTRVRICAAHPGEGSDHDWHGHTGTIIHNREWTLVRMDRRKRDWPGQDIYICNHNLRRLKST